MPGGKILVRSDNKKFSQLAKGTWNGETNMKVVTFQPVPGRHFEMEAMPAISGFSTATEIGTDRRNPE